MARRLALLTLLTGMLLAVPGPHDAVQAALHRSGPIDGIWTTDGAGGNLAFVPHTDNGYDPAWSPDGTQIAFVRGGDQDDGLPIHVFTVGAGGGAATQVTFGATVDLMPSWQPL
jgi:dipeptidyl aminopeptidase/acylaminoacyl peptidase